MKTRTEKQDIFSCLRKNYVIDKNIIFCYGYPRMDEKQIDKLVNDLKDIEIQKGTHYYISDFILHLDSTERFKMALEETLLGLN